MKISLRFIFAALAATAALTACTKEPTPPNFENDKVNPATEGSRVIAVSFSPQTKTALDDFQPFFVDGDKILVANGQDEPDTCIVSVKDGKATISTNLTGTLKAVYPAKAAKMNESNNKEIGGVLVFTEQDGTFANANICMVKNIPEEAKEVTFVNKTAVFRIIPVVGAQYVEVSAEGYEIANDYTDESAYKSGDIIHVAPITADTVYVSTRVPSDLTIGSLTFSDGTNEKTVTGDKASTKIEAGSLYTVTKDGWGSAEADIPEPLKGVFTVSAGPDGIEGTNDDLKVRFSKGNLYCKRSSSESSDWTWGIYEHQYDCNSLNASISEWDDDFGGNRTATADDTEIDLFTWGVGDWSTSPTTSSYLETPSVGNVLSGNEEWGAKIGNGWRTLTCDEFKYVLATRTNASNKTKAGVTVCGVKNCMLIAPDECLNEYSFNKSKKTYTEEEWETAEAAGILCLPTTGLRQENKVNNVRAIAQYWTSTSVSTDKASSPLQILANQYTLSTGNGDMAKNVGYAVRLAKDVVSE